MMISWDLYAMINTDHEYYYPSSNIQNPDPDNAEGKRILLAQTLLARQKEMLRGTDTTVTAQSLCGTERIVPTDLDLSWCEVPILVCADSKTAKIFPFLLGLTDTRMLQVEEGIFKEKSLNALERARLAVTPERGWLVIARYSLPQQPITGSSLALPFAVAAQFLQQGKRLSPEIFLTGDVSIDGHIHKVGWVSKKYAAFSNAGGSLFLYPEENSSDSLPNDAQAHAFTVTTVVAAIAICDLPTHVFLSQLNSWRNAPQMFFHWLLDSSFVPAALPGLVTLAEKEGWFTRFTDNASRANAVHDLYNWHKIDRNNRWELPRLLAAFPLSVAETLDPLNRLRLAGLNMTICNHKGMVAGSWYDLALSCRKIITTKKNEERSDVEFNEVLISLVRDTIGVWHNGYFFQNPVPAEWMDNVEAWRAFLKRRRTGKNDDLGQVYGALTHLAAFAGDYDRAIAYADISKSFFTRPADIVRRHIDRMYIFCDSEKHEEALRSFMSAFNLKKSLETADKVQESEITGETMSRLQDPFLHAAFVRLCAFSSNLWENYDVEGLLIRAKNEQSHPWQLWAYNCGKLATNTDIARECLRTSLAICKKESHGVAFLPMVLLPLSALLLRKLEDPTWICEETKKTVQAIAKHCDDGTLCAEHFAPILVEKDTTQILQFVANKKRKLFPFNYR